MLRYLYLCLLLTLSTGVCAQFGNLLNRAADKAESVLRGETPLSQEEVGEALKEALNEGTTEAVSFLSQANGYYASPYKILLPEEAQTVVSRVSALPGLGNVEQDLTERLNRAAELAAAKAAPIFVDAIRGLSFRDAMNLLMGEQDAATRYLEATAGQSLASEFRPVIKESLDEVNATDLWNRAATAYNKVPFTKAVTTELDAYVTQRALEGLFALVEVKETELRENPALRNTELLRRVFARQDR